MMKAYFELSGYQVLTACGGKRSIEKGSLQPGHYPSGHQ